ncbi:MAG TPA: hypothetical protein DEO32_02140 [Ruminococcaceae bacterium]|nr:hypothetical protein [Oscillospiraceae bacterium]
MNGFAKGKDVTVYLDGIILGGVREVQFNVKSTVYNIGEYLTDIPAAKIPSRSHCVKLKLENAYLAPFDCMETLELCQNGERIIFSGCAVSDISASIPPRGEVVNTVTVEAAERSIIHE